MRPILSWTLSAVSLKSEIMTQVKLSQVCRLASVLGAEEGILILLVGDQCRLPLCKPCKRLGTVF